MTQEEVFSLFRQQAAKMTQEAPSQGDLIRDLAQLLADSRGRLSKENFDMLVHIGAVLYKDGLNQFNARKNVSEIMRDSIESRQK